MKSALKGLTARAGLIIAKEWALVKDALRGFLSDQCSIRASALTYTTLLSIVPFLSIGFAMLKGLGVQRRIELFLLERFTPASQDVIARIMEYVDRTNASSLGALGTIGLLVTAVITLRTMEGAFNVIWRVPRSRPWVRSLADYTSVLVIAPICALVALSLTAYFNSPGIVEKMESVWLVGGIYRLGLKVSPLLILWVAFTLCYLLVPNTKVRLRSAALGAGVTALLWQLAQWAYVKYQFGVAKYNAIYGALSQLPVLCVWIYLSWVIVLLGAEVAKSHQCSRTRGDLGEGVLFLQWVIMILERIHNRFRDGKRPFEVEELLGEIPLEREHAMRALQTLTELGWIAPWSRESDLVVFVRDPKEMKLSHIARTPHQHHGEVWRRLHEAIEKALDGLTVADLGKTGDIKYLSV